MSWTTTNQATRAQELYTSRAQEYDEGNSGWHIRLGHDFTTMVDPQPGETVLDLACGTGLVTFPMAERVGRDGLVVGVDVTRAMLDVARTKLESISKSITSGIGNGDGDGDGEGEGEGKGKRNARVELAEADITDETALRSIPAVQEVLSQRGGFDVVVNCSCLVLLPDPAAAIKMWSRLLRPKGGRMIVDVVTKRKTLQYLSTELLGEKVEVSWPFSRSWVNDIHSLERLMEQAGLTVQKSVVYGNEDVRELNEIWDGSQGMQVLEEKVLGKIDRYRGKEREVREVWPELWRGALWEDGRFHDAHELFITIARRS